MLKHLATPWPLAARLHKGKIVTMVAMGAGAGGSTDRLRARQGAMDHGFRP